MSGKKVCMCPCADNKKKLANSTKIKSFEFFFRIFESSQKIALIKKILTFLIIYSKSLHVHPHMDIAERKIRLFHGT